MSDPDHLHVDLADTDDIRAKLPRARMLLENKRKAAHETQRNYLEFKSLYERLAVIAGELEDDTPAPNLSKKASPIQDAVVRIVSKVGRPMPPAAVAAAMREEGIKVASTNAVNSALNSARKAGRLSKPSKGLFAPPGYEGDTEPNQELLASNGRPHQASSDPGEEP
jgi:hypothetical protein